MLDVKPHRPAGPDLDSLDSGIASAAITPRPATHGAEFSSVLDAKVAFLSSMCAFFLLLASICGNAVRAVPANQNDSIARWLLTASLALESAAVAALVACTLRNHSAIFISLATANMRLRINRCATFWRTSSHTRHAADLVLVCTTVSLNLMLIAKSCAGNASSAGLPHELVICSPVLCYALLREVRSATALWAWALSSAVVGAASVQLGVWAYLSV